MRLLTVFLSVAALWGAGDTLSVRDFQSPAQTYRPMPFWAWTGDVHREQIRRQLRLMHDQRLTNVMFYPRFGLEVPYFSEEFLGLIRYSVDQAKALGMNMWLYDEYTWPSGTAGKRIPREHPEYRSAALCVFQHYVSPHDARRRADLLLPDDVVHIVAVSPEGRKIVLKASPDKWLHWAAPAGAWRVQVYWAFRADDYVDSLNPEAMRRFIEITYEGYKKVVGDAFGTVIKGIFTDEPVMFHRAPTKFGEYDVTSFPWTARLPAEFRAQHGYDLLDRLPEVLTGGTVRRDLWATATRLYSEAYHRQIGDWCRRNGIDYTGHILDEDWLPRLIKTEGDFFLNQRWAGMPGVDEINNRPGFGGDYPKRKIPMRNSTNNDVPGEWVPPKMAQATAEIIGARRTLVEAHAYGPPSITLNELRRVVNWESVLGINTFLIAVFPSSLRGSTISTGWLPALFYQQPWYRYYKHHSDYIARTSYLLTRGERVSSVGLVHPTISCWGSPGMCAETSTPLRELARLLLTSQKDFTVVFESGLDKAPASKLDAIYVPPLEHIEPALARFLKEFCGKVYFYGKRPDGISAGEVINAGHFPVPPGPQDVRVTSPDARRILVQQRRAGDATIAFLVNVSTGRTDAQITVPAKGRAEFWDATTGEIRPATNPVRHVFEPGEGVFLVVRPGAAQTVPPEPAVSTVEIKGPWEFRAERENSLRLKGWKQGKDGRWETEVELEHVPSRLEMSLSQDLLERLWINGREVDWSKAGSRYLDDHNREVDITRLVRPGRNAFRVQSAYSGEFPYLFFGYLIGDFSVRGGKVVAPVRQVANSWTAAGYPEYAGTGIFTKTIEGVQGRVTLELADVAMDAVEVHLNGQLVSTRLWEPYRFDLTGKLRPGANRLEIRVTNSLANMMFGPLRAGLLGPVRLLVQKEGAR